MPSTQKKAREEIPIEAFFDNTSDAIVITDTNGAITHWNHGAETLFLIEAPEALSMYLWDVVALSIHPEDKPELGAEGTMTVILGLLRYGSVPPPMNPEGIRILRRDGTVRIAQPKIFSMASDHGFRVGCIIRDVTERSATVPQLRSLTMATEQSPVSVVITDVGGNIEYVNRKFIELTGYTLEEAKGKNPRILKSGETKPDVYGELWSTILAGRSWRGTFKNRKKDGGYYWEEAKIAPIIEPDGKVSHFIALKEDITERKMVEDALAERLKELRGIAAVRAELEHRLSLAEFCSRVIRHVADSMQFPQLAFPVIDLGYTRYTKDNHVPVTTGTLVSEVSADGISLGRLTVGYGEALGFLLPEEQEFLDIIAQSIGFFLARSASDEKVRAARDRFELIFNKSPDAIVVTRLSDGLIVECNDGFYAMTGFSKEDIRDRTATEINLLSDPKDRLKVIEGLKEKGYTTDVEYAFKKKDGTSFFGAGSVALMDIGNVAHIISIIRDVTEQRRVEAALRESEKKFKNLIWDMKVGVLLQGPNAEIALCNPKALELLGLSEDQLLGKTSFDPDWNVIHEDGSPFPGNTHPVPRAITLKLPVRNVVMGVFRPSSQDRAWLLVDAEPQMGVRGEVLQVICTFIDISERKRAEEALVRSEDKFRTVIQNIDVYIYVLDFENGLIVSSFHSPQCRRITGYAPEEFTQKPELWLELVYPDDLPEVKEFFEANRSGKNMQPIEHRIVNRNGDIHWVLNTTTVELSGAGEVRRMEGFVIDITDRVIMEHSLREAMNAAELANRAKSEFLASMSHELRTPLNSILGFSQMLGMEEVGTLNGKQREFLRNIRGSGDHLLQMISSTLDLAKIEAGKIELEKTVFAVADTLEELMGTMQGLAAKKSITLKLDLGKDLGLLEADETRVKQILFNLLSNALKFTGAGLSVGLDARAEGNRLELTVWDEGIGIAGEDQKRIFEPYEQVRARNSANQGTGLGLYITQRLIDLHGGKVTLESDPGKGSRFIISLPGRIEPEGSSENDRERKESEPAAQDEERYCGRVLIVEDSLLNQELMKSILEMFGCVYAVAETGTAAVEMALSQPFDLILMDIDLPDIDGIEAMRRIRRVSKRKVPIVALTAHVMEGDAERFVSSGMDGVLAKPFEIGKLKALLMKHSDPVCDDGEDEVVPELEVVHPSYDMGEVALSMGIPVARLEPLVSLFLSTLSPEYSLSLKQAVEAGDFALIRAAAHKYRGAAANLRLESCAGILNEMERAAEDSRKIDYCSLLGQLERELVSLRGELSAETGT